MRNRRYLTKLVISFHLLLAPTHEVKIYILIYVTMVYGPKANNNLIFLSIITHTCVHHIEVLMVFVTTCFYIPSNVHKIIKTAGVETLFEGPYRFTYAAGPL